MINTCLVFATPQSSASEEIRLYPLRRHAMVFWQSGHYSAHTVRRRDMLRLLLNPKQSAGAWINAYALA
tara:strand:- start:577 stop:783 length:207 start_codon:yes stop_codon:yes gene_type:complete